MDERTLAFPPLFRGKEFFSFPFYKSPNNSIPNSFFSVYVRRLECPPPFRHSIGFARLRSTLLFFFLPLFPMTYCFPTILLVLFRGEIAFPFSLEGFRKDRPPPSLLPASWRDFSPLDLRIPCFFSDSTKIVLVAFFPRRWAVCPFFSS